MNSRQFSTCMTQLVFVRLNRANMKLILLLFAFIVCCNSAPAPEPAPEPKPLPGPSPKPNPGLLIPASPTIITSPVVTYSQYYKSPLYPAYQPYLYNYGYASAYPYGAYPYYVPLHYI